MLCCSYFLADDRTASDTARLGSRGKGLNTLIWFAGAVVGYVSQSRGDVMLPAPALEGYIAARAIWLVVFKGPWRIGALAA